MRDGRMEMQNSDKEIDDFAQDTNSGTLTFGIQNRFDFYSTVGAYRTEAGWRIKEGKSFSKIKLQTHYDLSWSVGVKGIFFEWGNTTLTAGSRYSDISSELLWLTKNGVPKKTNNADFKYKEWQVDIAISHKIDFLVPYIGTQYSNTHAYLEHINHVVVGENASKHLRMKGREHFGLSLGCAITAKKYFFLNVEARLINEYAFSVVGEFRF
jgi:hypothetical protein